MATKLFLRSTQNNGIGATYYDMVTAAGAAADTAVVNTAASGTEIQWTKTAGGAVAQWISGPAPAGGFTLTSTDISIWAQESNGQANCGGRFRVFKRAANGVETELGGGPFNDGVEFGTSAAEMLWVGNVTDTAFAENDRILLKVYITNVGTMGSGRTCTLTFNAADGQTGDSFFNIAETVTFKAEPATGTGALTAASAALSGAGVSSSAGTGSPASAASTASGAGESSSSGTGALSAAESTAAGEGEVTNSEVTGTGALAADAATAAGAGDSSSTGTGALTGQAAAASGEGVSESSGSGAAVSQAPGISAEGLSASVGTGDLAAGASIASGTQSSLVEGQGALTSAAAAVSGDGISASIGSGALAPGQIIITGAGVTVSLGNGAAASEAAGISGADGATGTASLTAGQPVIVGLGLVEGSARRRVRTRKIGSIRNGSTFGYTPTRRTYQPRRSQGFSPRRS